MDAVRSDGRSARQLRCAPCRIDLLHPRHRAGWFGAELTRWLLAAASGLRGVHLRPVELADASPGAVTTPADARVVVIRDGGRGPDVGPLIDRAPTLPLALVAYGGRTRGRPALDRARATLERAGVPVAMPSLGINAAGVREEGFVDADALLWSLLLEDLRDVSAVTT